MKISNNVWKVMAGVMIAAFALGGCSSGKKSGTIKIGTSFPLTGSVAADGKLIMNALNMAVEEINASGGIKGKQVELVSEDDEANPTAAAAIANKFVVNEDILAVVTSYNSSCGLAQIPIYKESSLVAISPVTTSTDITGLSKYYYRTCNNDGYVAAMCAQISKDIGFKKVAVLYEQDDYGFGIYKHYTDEAKNLGLEIADVETFIYGETKDFSTIITNVKAANVDGIYFAGLVTEMSLFASQAKQQGLDLSKIPVLADEGCYSPAMIKEGGEAVEGMYTLGAFSSDDTTPVVQKFVTDYNAKYGEKPGAWSALAYDAIMTVFEAMKSADKLERESINDAMQVVSYQGVTGLNKFTNSDVAKTYNTYQIQKGQFVKVN